MIKIQPFLLPTELSFSKTMRIPVLAFETPSPGSVSLVLFNPGSYVGLSYEPR